MAESCPTLQDILAGEDCLENMAGVGATIFVGLKADLAAPLTLTKNTYSTPTFKSGKGLYQIDCKDDSNKIEGESLGRRKGFKQTLTLVLESVSKAMGETSRALNNLDLFYIVPDGEDSQILYDPYRKVTYDSGGIKSDTGAAASDERTTTCTAALQPVKYMNMYVTAPSDGGWESLLASKAG